MGAVLLLAGPATEARVADSGAPVSEARVATSGGEASPSSCAAAPKRVEMTPTPRARGARGTMIVRMAASPYGVAVDPDGSYRLRVEVAVEGLRSGGDTHHVVWGATPELDRHVRLGTLGPDDRATGEVAWNKFLVFVTAEEAPDPESWSQQILLSALSPSAPHAVASALHSASGYRDVALFRQPGGGGAAGACRGPSTAH